ncbi:hypothetical protein NYO67_8746 [Aspergillus flavus]|nr:hypothetical protein NYO67_8746 [Aspergillus flavus]
MRGALSQLPAVYYRDFPGLGHLPVYKQLVKPSYVDWDRRAYQGEPGNGNFDSELRKGNFDGGETIQVTADNCSWYKANGLVPLNRVSRIISNATLEMLRGWLETCLENHNTCSMRSSGNTGDTTYNGEPGEAILPTRLIDVGCSEDSELCPRLVQTGGMTGTYIALSHRWGSQELTLKTLSSNVQSLQRSLPVDSLPRTYRQAIEVTRQLSVRYIWIDSLCIVQDDSEDWKRESQKMADVFEKCICVIAATDSVDSQGQDHGIFLPRNDPLAVDICIPLDRTPLRALSTRVFKKEKPTFVWKYRWPVTNHLRNEQMSTLKPKDAAICLRPRIQSLSVRLRHTAWYNRGWVLQERLLPSRIIYFTKDKLYWSCFTTTEEEENSDPRLPHRQCIFQSKGQGMEYISDHWQSILSDYINCSVTFDRDKLMAIDGITRRFEQYYSIEIHAGVLDDRTGRSLLWFVREPSAQEHSGFHAPSWSWASLTASVSFSLAQPLLTEQRCLVRDLRYEITNSCPMNNPGGVCWDTCLSGQVSFTGLLGKLTRSPMSLKNAKFEGFQGEAINNNDIMSRLLGSAIFSCSSLQSFDDEWNEIPTQRDLFVPEHTELLTDDGLILGFLIPDHARSPPANETIFCAAVQQWEGKEARLNCEIDFIGLENVENDSGVYRRVGRGRIICNAWLSTCKKRTIKII